MAKHVSAKEARNKFSDLMGSVHYGGEEIILERSGKPMAAMIPVEVYERLVAERRARFEVLNTIRSNLPDVSPEEIEKDVARTISKLRATRAEGRS
ncbi:MAG: type II toxin-antitoxin system Phd/YefM family antitoxin [Deltaproteobacteria bacterium]|nr:type II toxin-antitoxin system Phd/YefM family antitoxin [Deltaproteobacteria bacterium]